MTVTDNLMIQMRSLRASTHPFAKRLFYRTLPRDCDKTTNLYGR